MWCTSGKGYFSIFQWLFLSLSKTLLGQPYCQQFINMKHVPHKRSHNFTETHGAALIFAMTSTPADPTPESIHFLTRFLSSMLGSLSEEPRMEWQLVCTWSCCDPCPFELIRIMHMVCTRLEHLCLELSGNWGIPPNHQVHLGLRSLVNAFVFVKIHERFGLVKV